MNRRFEAGNIRQPAVWQLICRDGFHGQAFRQFDNDYAIIGWNCAVMNDHFKRGKRSGSGRTNDSGACIVPSPTIKPCTFAVVRCVTPADFYLRSEQPSLAALILEVKRQFAEQQLPAPDYRTVRRRVEALDLRLVIKKREGAKRAREKLGPVKVSSLRPELPMDVLQIDIA